MSDEPDPFDEVSAVEYDPESGEIYLTDDAPDELIEAAERNPHAFEARINFTIALVSDPHFESDEYTITDARLLSEWHYSKVDEAVEDADGERAKDHKKRAEQYKRQYDKFLYGEDDER